MKHLVILLFFPVLSYSQDSWNSLGADIENFSGNISCSVGQLFTENYSAGGFVIFEGVQIPFVISDLHTQKGPDNELMLFPNPVSSVLYLKSDAAFQVLRIRDISGRVVEEFNNLTGNGTGFNVSSLSDGTYFLDVLFQGTIQALPFIKN